MNHVRDCADRVGKASWGIFFVWIGIAFLMHLRWATGLPGVGVIALGAQVIRKSLGSDFEWFGVVTGTAFVIWSAWELMGIQLSLLAVLSIAVGALIIVSALGKTADKSWKVRAGVQGEPARTALLMR